MDEYFTPAFAILLHVFLLPVPPMRRIAAIVLSLSFIPGIAAAASLAPMQGAIEAGRYIEAIELGEALLDDNPGHPGTRFLIAYAQQMAGNTDLAAALYRDLINEHPELPEPRNNLAMILLAAGDYDRASALLVDALNTHPSYATAYANLSAIYKGIASEAYRRAVSESSEPARYTHNIELVAINRLESLTDEPLAAPAAEVQSAINFANQETRLIEQITRWAQAWSEQDVATYAGFYADSYRGDFRSHEAWLEHRRERIRRPGEIRVEVSDIQIRWRSDNRAIVDFKQAFDSPGYSDRVVKRLAFNRFGSEWKITEERVLSAL